MITAAAQRARDYQRRAELMNKTCHGCKHNALEPWEHATWCPHWMNKVGHSSGA